MLQKINGSEILPSDISVANIPGIVTVYIH